MIKHNTERKPKGLWTANNGGEKIKYYEAMTERDEAEYVVREIIKHRKSEKTIMIWQFCIEQMHNHVLEETFMKSNIPYTMVEAKVL